MSKELAQGGDHQPQDTKQGHCSRCGKVWTLAEAQGVCQWCGKSASCQQSRRGSSRSIKSRRRKQKQSNGIGNGYNQLPEPYFTCYNVAKRFAYKVLADDQEDLLHNIILTLAEANGHKALSEAAMYRIASRAVADYWREHYKLTNSLTCCNCSKAQRQKCRKDWLYPQCPKAIKLESLNKPIIDSEGNLTELGELIADDHALDIPQWLELNEQILHTPDRALAIADKIQGGETLTSAERVYLCKARKRLQKTLF